MTGTNRGAMSSALRAALPGKAPRTSPKAAIVPSIVATIEVAQAIRRLVATDSSQRRLSKNFRYWASDTLRGGNSAMSAQPSDMGRARAAVAVLVYLLFRNLRKTFPRFPRPALIAGLVFLVGVGTLPSIPRYQFHSEMLQVALQIDDRDRVGSTSR